ncbi:MULTISPECIES: SDR family oxidoreductase [unclassified Streptomyces]|uniref:SDR family oxidoreductase n=1 Tax=unclassified Streptomyces TaxID=2593676 RepID=UPI0001B5743A|nr:MULTISPECIES: SDR family oxidoreductase [unclassified Streptomyces]MYR28013.1 SDR family oxidoreductase [Streptomyces sp. SID4945]SCF32718.1 NAD(P)-dependent dehydrogenase, short-chain alcohol dehydrogenase family [Streptomyces sp. LcepLS]
MSTYDGKKIVITGGSSGIGLAAARLFAEGGGHVLITGRTRSTLDTALEQLGHRAVGVRSDAASLKDIRALADTVRGRFGAVDALFVNAGVTASAPFGSTTEEMYDALFDTNAKGPYFTVQALAPLLREGSGVVLTTSVVNVLGLEALSAYSASKAALRSMTRTLARELLPRKVRVNAVSPGPTDTGVLDRSVPTAVAEAMKDDYRSTIPMRRLGTSEEVAAAVAYLAFGATFSTGAEFPVDGGASQL